MMKRWVLLLFLWPSISFCATSDSLYQINLIVFQNLDKSGLSAEIWPANPPQPNFTHAVEFDSGSYALLPSNQFGMKNALQRLKNSGNYKVLTAIAWQQRLTSPATAPSLHVYAGKAYATDGTILSDSANHASNWELNGTVKASMTNYIEFTAKFLLTERVPVVNTDKQQDNSPQTQLMSFPLHETIRTRSGEIHYLDNPLYGVLVLITPAA